MGDMVGQYRAIQTEIDAAVAAVFARGSYILGPDVKALETEIAALCGASHGVAVNSGTDALLISMLALGFEPGDEIITTPFTFFATAEAISHTGATPVFVDIDPATFNIDPAAIEAAITPRTKAIVPVHLYGQAADMDAIMAIAQRHGLAVVEDAAQIIGGSYKGRPAGSLGSIAAFSFYPTKNLGAAGDGGMIVTNDADLAEKARVIRFHGSGGGYYYERLGYCSRLDEIQAAVLRVKLRYLKGWNDARRGHAAFYNEALAGSSVTTPAEADGCRHIYHQYTVRSADRGALKEHLAANGIDSGIYYPLPLHLQDVYRGLGLPLGSLPRSEAAAREVLSLPVYPELTQTDLGLVAETIRGFQP
ncbi:MAG TPA: DegT/DnrJ/EryC1/StrS family aminotransferase [Armatimonadota bacterium]|jgi:dTDP-4-amino-4,6-dideoxygalactose transaminase